MIAIYLLMVIPTWPERKFSMPTEMTNSVAHGLPVRGYRLICFLCWNEVRLQSDLLLLDTSVYGIYLFHDSRKR